MNHLMAGGLRLIQQFREELRVNPRLIRLVWLAVYFSALLVVAGLMDVNDQLGSKARKMLSDLARVSTVGNKEVWSNRLEQQKVYQSEMLRHCNKATNSGLASADIQTVLQQLLVRYELINSRLTVSEPELASRGLGRINGQITGRIEQGNLLPMLNSLEDPSYFFSIERLVITVNSAGDAIDLLVSSCFQVTEE